MKLRSLGTAGLAAMLLASGAGAAPALDGGLPLQELPQQKLGAGQCALVLWTRTTPTRRILMALSQPASARVQAGGKTLELARTAWKGEAAFGHYPEQSFKGNGVELSLALEIDSTTGLVGGAVVRSGTVEYRDSQGWSTVLPVAGMLACQT